MPETKVRRGDRGGDHATDPVIMPEGVGTVLVLAPDGRNSELIVDLLQRSGIEARASAEVAEFASLLDEFGAETGAVVTTDRARALGVDTAITKFQAEEPHWSALPIVLLTERANGPRPTWRNLVQIPQPVSGRQLLDVLGIALDGRKRQHRLAHANRRLEHMAFHDVLTGLPNRAALFAALDRLQNERRADGSPFSVLFLDVDHFKLVNDRHGHAAGDELLRAIATSVTEAVREEDIVARLAGDEFIVVLTGTDSEARAATVARRLSQDRWVRLEGAGLEVILSLSVGVLDDVAEGDDPDDIIARADRRMYEDKLAKSSLVAQEVQERG